MLVGVVCFVLGANLGFILAGLMHAARRGDDSRPADHRTPRS